MVIQTSGWALDKTDFKKITDPITDRTLASFATVPLYYLELPIGIRFADIRKNDGRKAINFFLDPHVAEKFRLEKERISGKTGAVKKIPMSFILKAIYSQSSQPEHTSQSAPSLSISAGAGSQEVFFYFLAESLNMMPYSLEFRKKKTIPVFVSKQSAENMLKILISSGSAGLQLETYSLEDFLSFLRLQDAAGIPVRIFPYDSHPQYTAIRPMTWGVGSSYLFGAFMVLFLFWAITRSSKKK